MFDVGWSEILVIAAVAIIVVGPKDLPRMLRTFGKTMGQVRRTANDFKRQFDEALREAEREAGLEDAKKQITEAAKPLSDVKKDLDATMRAAEKPVVASSSAPVPAPSPEPEPTGDHPHAAEPVKTGAPTPAHGSDAA